MTELEKAICRKFGVKYGVFTGNGTTAMFLAFMALEMQKKKVIFPAISCTNPVNAAIYAGYEVDFCDVSINDFTIDLFELETMLKTGNYGIIVPTHIYGHRYDENKIRKLCKDYGVILMEDAAQSYYIGDMDISIMSFGHTKICDTELGGGIALTNDFELMKKMLEQKKIIPTLNQSYTQLLQEYRRKYYCIVKYAHNWNERNNRIKKLQLENRDYFIYDLNENNEIFDKLTNIDKMVSFRKEKTKVYDQLLNDKYIEKIKKIDNYRWRYTFLYKGNRDKLLEKVREKNIDISSWYYSLAGIYKEQHLKNADIVEKNVINLWVDESHSVNKIKNDISIINNIMEQQY